MYHNDFQPPDSGSSINIQQNEISEQVSIYHACVAQLKMQSGALALTVIVNILLLYLFQTAGAWLVVRLIQITGFDLISMDAVNELYTMLLYVVAFLLPYLIYAKAVEYHLDDIPRDQPYPPVLAASIGVSLGLSVAGILLSMIISIFFSFFGLYPMRLPLELPQDSFAAALFILNTIFIPASIEEFVNRGIVLGSLRKYGDRFAIIVSALIFALLHRNMAQIPNAFLLGLAMGYFVVKTNSIWTGILIHFTNNLLVLIISVSTLGLSDLQGIFATGLLFLFYLIACGWGLIYFLKIRRLDMSLFPSCCPVEERSLYRSYLLNFPTIMMLLLFVWVIYLNFERF
ncbi:type II CAAX endopeptidase family protein [Oscillospiraceae bacterium PP1C4]